MHYLHTNTLSYRLTHIIHQNWSNSNKKSSSFQSQSNISFITSSLLVLISIVIPFSLLLGLLISKFIFVGIILFFFLLSLSFSFLLFLFHLTKHLTSKVSILIKGHCRQAIAWLEHLFLCFFLEFHVIQRITFLTSPLTMVSE